MAGVWSKNEKEKFINPYNFVPATLHGRPNRPALLKADEKLHTGVLHCTLTVKTPLAVPDTGITSAEESGKHKFYSFFQYKDGVPVIPGSTLRGSIRSMYEALSDSCFSTARPKSVITTRGKGTFSPGVLKKGNKSWKLYAAERYLIDVYSKPDSQGPAIKKSRQDLLDKYGFGAKVLFRSKEGKGGKKYVIGPDLLLVKEDGKAQQGFQEGYLYVGEPFSKKKYESVFEIKQGANGIAVGEKELNGLLQTIDVYQDEKVNKNLGKKHGGYKYAKAAFEQGIVPIWYRQDGKRTYLSMACIGRTAYQKNMGELLDKRAACSTEDLCKACALFGMASENYNSGSKVRVTDAKALECKVRQGVTLRELASPHSSYLPFYATKANDVRNWSYDTNADIRGRKFYWHSDSKYYMDRNQTKRNATMDLVEPGAVFEFKVYYDDITEEQLNELIWTLALGDNSRESSYCYKIGHGKPIGLGSVKICVERNVERSFGPEGYHIIDQEVGEINENPFNTSPALEQILAISNMKTVANERVEYPRVIPANGVRPDELNDNEKAAHQWFTNNYKLGAKTVGYTLPAISKNKASLKLPVLEMNRKK